MSEEQKNGTLLSEAPASPLPELSAEDFKVYNCYAHTAFRNTWTTIYDACVSNELPKAMSLDQLIETGKSFCNDLRAHHDLEEQMIFPYFSERMPAFGDKNHKDDLLSQHEQIHTGLTKILEYLLACEGRQKEFELKDLKAIMDVFGEVLWLHMDDEVDQLRAENMRKYWSLEEIKAMPFYEPPE
ncbi:hypothetical protein AJ78_05413 [Emergomyces pasteurianus Ep9510]|uniref:Hemerythrin-like domain-containing protein n=1 Tax=Emergomyces pasteurianus Ep9510 TaxID=1447872 RepID=A0A1J9Q215_9EURO|nr:hypothetical protein AJ78_05413 [Emergomyces pasteurianus Ep9510]